MPSTESIITTWKPVKAHVAPVVAEVANRYGPIYFVWGKSNGKSGEHPKGLALDFSVLEKGDGVSRPGPARKALGDAIAEYLWHNRARLHVWHVIWNRRIISTTYPDAGWRPYRGRSPHTDHVHVSFKATGTYSPPGEPKRVSLSALTRAAKSDPDRSQGGTTPGAADDVRLVEVALRKEGLLPAAYASDGSFGELTVKAYKRWQHRCDFSGSDADGIPGRQSLTRLGRKHGFTVVP